MDTPAVVPTPIVYARTEIDGIIVRPESRGVLLKALAENRPIEVSSGNDYINLYHVFERIAAAEPKKYGKHAMVRKQIGPDKWLVFLAKKKDDVPDVPLISGYDPKRGRYKRYALELKEGNAVILDQKAEAIKARRAWQLYVPGPTRPHLRSTVKKTKAGKYMVMIMERSG